MHKRRSSLEQTAPDLDSQMTGGGDRRHWQRANGCTGRDADGDTVNDSTESKTDRHSNPMSATATPTSGTETEGKEKTLEKDLPAMSIKESEQENEEKNRAAIRLGVLYSIYKPDCFYFDIINIFHVRSFASRRAWHVLFSLCTCPRDFGSVSSTRPLIPRFHPLLLSLSLSHRNYSSGRRSSSLNAARNCRWARLLSSM